MKNGGADAVFHARSDALYPGASVFKAVEQNGSTPRPSLLALRGKASKTRPGFFGSRASFSCFCQKRSTIAESTTWKCSRIMRAASTPFRSWRASTIPW